MVERNSPLNVAILAVPEVTASALYGMFDLFSSPGRDFLFITSGAAGTPRMRPYVVAGDGSPFRAANGIWVGPDPTLGDCPPPDIVCIPDFYVNPGENLDGQYDAEAAWLKRAHD